MEESPGAGFKCCPMCKRHCFETHGNFGRSEAEELFSAPTFFRLIETAHITGSKFLRIPVLFLERWNYNIVGTLSLIGPYGFECEVTVRRHNHGFVLRTGFDAFVEHHMVEAGDSLVFYLIAESSFLVKVYDKCGSEKILQTKNTNIEEDTENTEDSDGEGSCEKVVDLMLRSRQKKLSKKTKEVEVRSREEAEACLPSNQQEPSFPTDQPAASLGQQGNSVDVSPVSKNLDAGGLKQPESSRIHRSARKRKLSATPDAYHGEERENELDKPSESESIEVAKREVEVAQRQVKAANDLMETLHNPSQFVVMSASHIVHHRVHLSKLKLPNISTYLTLLDERGEQYNVKWCVQSKGSNSRLSAGWSQIVVDHKLVIDDICIFEATDPLLIKVYIFPLAKYRNLTTENQQQEQDVELFAEPPMIASTTPFQPLNLAKSTSATKLRGAILLGKLVMKSEELATSTLEAATDYKDGQNVQEKASSAAGNAAGKVKQNVDYGTGAVQNSAQDVRKTAGR